MSGTQRCPQYTRGDREHETDNGKLDDRERRNRANYAA
jgi:hypothetical protein